jgi:hypothetical protein
LRLAYFHTFYFSISIVHLESALIWKLPDFASQKFIVELEAVSTKTTGPVHNFCDVISFHSYLYAFTTETIDRDKEIVIAGGMRDDHFNHNPLVTLNHCYELPPIGKSIWRRPVVIARSEFQPNAFDKGVLAKTLYPPKPEDWSDSWAPDEVLMLIQSGLLNGKSIGFISTKRRSPTDADVKANPSLADVRSIIEEWILLEYACCPIPCNPHTTVAGVSKSLRSALGWSDPADSLRFASTSMTPDTCLLTPDVPFTTETEIRAALTRHISQLNIDALAKTTFDRILDQHRGRV